jgi:hypothetical protein
MDGRGFLGKSIKTQKKERIMKAQHTSVNKFMLMMSCLCFNASASEYPTFVPSKEVVEDWGQTSASSQDTRLQTEAQRKEQLRNEEALQQGIIRRSCTSLDGRRHVTFVDTRFQELARKDPQAFQSFVNNLQQEEKKSGQTTASHQRPNVYGDYDCRGCTVEEEGSWTLQAVLNALQESEEMERKSTAQTFTSSSSNSSSTRSRPQKKQKLDNSPEPSYRPGSSSNARDTWCTRLCAWAYKN